MLFLSQVLYCIIINVFKAHLINLLSITNTQSEQSMFPQTGSLNCIGVKWIIASLLHTLWQLKTCSTKLFTSHHHSTNLTPLGDARLKCGWKSASRSLPHWDAGGCSPVIRAVWLTAQTVSRRWDGSAKNPQTQAETDSKHTQRWG